MSCWKILPMPRRQQSYNIESVHPFTVISSHVFEYYKSTGLIAAAYTRPLVDNGCHADEMYLKVVDGNGALCVKTLYEIYDPKNQYTSASWVSFYGAWVHQIGRTTFTPLTPKLSPIFAFPTNDNPHLLGADQTGEKHKPEPTSLYTRGKVSLDHRLSSSSLAQHEQKEHEKKDDEQRYVDKVEGCEKS